MTALNAQDPAVAIVTGASSGIGRLVAAHLAALGCRVFGTSRNGRPGPEGTELLTLDVDDDTSVRTCVRQVLTQAQRIDLLINNAGRASVGACEETSADEARALFETNVFGVMRVTSQVLPTMRAQGSGRIVNVGSLSGSVGVPFHGIYAASKHALAGYSEALRIEVAPFGVQVSLVEPAAHRTTIQMEHPRQPMPLYDERRQRVEAIMRGQIETGGDPDRVAQVIVRAGLGRAGRFRYPVGTKAHLAGLARRLLPPATFEAFVRREFA